MLQSKSERNQKSHLHVQCSSTDLLTMMNITMSQRNSIEIENIEHSFQSTVNANVRILSLISLVMIFISNGYLIKVIMKETVSILDWMMILDSFIGIFNSIRLVLNILNGSGVLNNILLCIILNFFNYFINVCNKLLTIGIAVYRYVFVVKHNYVHDTTQRQIFTQSLVSTISMTSAIITGYAIYFKEKYKYFLCKCNFEMHMNKPKSLKVAKEDQRSIRSMVDMPDGQ